MFATLRMLGIGQERNAPVASLRPIIVSVILSVDCLATVKRKAPYSNFDGMRDLYICLRVVPFALHDV